MIPTRRPKSDEAKAAQSERMSAAHLDAHDRRRTAAVLAMLLWPNGVTPMPGLPDHVLRSLVARGLAEVRFVLTPAGRRKAEAARDA